MNYNEKFPRVEKWVSMPKVGEQVTVTIKTIRECKTGNPDFHFKQKSIEIVTNAQGEQKEISTDVNMGYHIECDLEGGKVLSVSSYSAFDKVFRKNNIQEGETITIQHLAIGKWKTIRGNTPDVPKDTQNKNNDLPF